MFTFPDISLTFHLSLPLSFFALVTFWILLHGAYIKSAPIVQLKTQMPHVPVFPVQSRPSSLCAPFRGLQIAVSCAFFDPWTMLRESLDLHSRLSA